jgi:hypothetical protein
MNTIRTILALISWLVFSVMGFLFIKYSKQFYDWNYSSWKTMKPSFKLINFYFKLGGSMVVILGLIFFLIQLHRLF